MNPLIGRLETSVGPHIDLLNSLQVLDEIQSQAGVYVVLRRYTGAPTVLGY